MKKFFFAVALLLGMSALFVSCNKDNVGSEGDYAKLIVGTWELTKGESYYQGKLIDTALGNGTTITFTEDGKYYISDYPDIKVNYSISGNKITITALGANTLTILKLTKDELQLEETTLLGILSELLEDDKKIDKAIAYYRKVK